MIIFWLEFFKSSILFILKFKYIDTSYGCAFTASTVYIQEFNLNIRYKPEVIDKLIPYNDFLKQIF